MHAYWEIYFWHLKNFCKVFFTSNQNQTPSRWSILMSTYSFGWNIKIESFAFCNYVILEYACLWKYCYFKYVSLDWKKTCQDNIIIHLVGYHKPIKVAPLAWTYYTIVSPAFQVFYLIFIFTFFMFIMTFFWCLFIFFLQFLKFFGFLQAFLIAITQKPFFLVWHIV